MKKFLRLFILRTICVPSDVIAHLIVLAVHLLWGRRLVFRKGILCTELDEKSWPSRTWYKNWGGTTFGHAMMFAAGQLDNPRIFNHEMVHVEQFEAENIQSLALACMFFSLGAPIWAVVVMAFGAFLNYIASVAAALLRGESSGYRGSHLEEAAYDNQRKS
ncbi:MAG: hypothetical protein L0220_24670 [Acidobacteria bacterium]|nr:hypothetical protein [Acidobacteriota bacterium]